MDAKASGVYFLGNAPNADVAAFKLDSATIVYYLPGTTGWGSTLGGCPAVLWNPSISINPSSLGVRTNHFGFNVTGGSNLVVVVQACTNLANPVWIPLQTITLTNGSFYFSDLQWTNYLSRFYQLNAP
jgi:hypothetical protein